jgi:sulfur-carrier protein adenylyltransferase/sulfurtransferase
MKEITVLELKSMLDNKEDFQLIDVREEHEYEMANLGGELLPMAEAIQSADKINRNKKVVIHCRSGARSAAVIKQLESTSVFDNLYNLKGGIIAWANEIDPSKQVS